MPVIFDKGHEKEWLQHNINTKDLSHILKPYRDNGLLITPDNGLVQMSML
jgi:putative SOS response-associated peptidase YedK